MSFEALHLNKSILKALAEKFYEAPTAIQEKCIPVIFARKDIIASAQTGTGKTAAFVLPIIDRLITGQGGTKKDKNMRALVVVPTRELATQISENIAEYGKYTNLRVGVIYGGLSMDIQIAILKKGIDILVATPGRLLDMTKRNLLSLTKVEILVIDEADMMLDMGFIDDVKKVDRLCPVGKQTLMFSATMPQKIVVLADEILKNPERISVAKVSSVSSKVNQSLYYVPKPKKIELCLYLLRNVIKGKIIVFRRTKFGVDKLEKSMVKNGYKVSTIHGGKSQTARQESLSQFKNNKVDILIGTDVASRGIDIDGLDAVINFDMPNVPEIYVHRIGRTGRAGETGNAYALCSSDELTFVTAIQKLTKKIIPVIEDHPYPLPDTAKLDVGKTIYSTQKSSHKGRSDKPRKKGRKSAASKKNKKRWY